MSTDPQDQLLEVADKLEASARILRGLKLPEPPKLEKRISREEFFHAFAPTTPHEKGASSVSVYIDRGQCGMERVEIEFPIVIRKGRPDDHK